MRGAWRIIVSCESAARLVSICRWQRGGTRMAQRRSGSRAEGGLGRHRHARGSAVHHGARHHGDERVYHAGRRGREHHGRRYADRHHHVHAGHGRIHAHRRQARRPLGSEAGVLDRPAGVRYRLDDDSTLAEPRPAARGLVAGRGPRRHSRHSRHRRADSEDLQGQAACAVLRDPRRCGRCIDGGRTAHRRMGDRVLLVALRLHRRDRDRAVRDAVPQAHPGDRGPEEQARHGRGRACRPSVSARSFSASCSRASGDG